jgi:hypothetical protein
MSWNAATCIQPIMLLGTVLAVEMSALRAPLAAGVTLLGTTRTGKCFFDTTKLIGDTTWYIVLRAKTKASILSSDSLFRVNVGLTSPAHNLCLNFGPSRRVACI